MEASKAYKQYEGCQGVRAALTSGVDDDGERVLRLRLHEDLGPRLCHCCWLLIAQRGALLEPNAVDQLSARLQAPPSGSDPCPSWRCCSGQR